MATCSACQPLSVEYLRKFPYTAPCSHHTNVGELKACAEATASCGICLLLWRTMDDLTRLDASAQAIRDHLDETYGLYGQFYDDVDLDFKTMLHETGGLASYESAIKIEAKFLTHNIGLSRTGIRVFSLEDSPAAKHFFERCTYADLSPDLSIRLGKKWLNICREYHEKCHPSASAMPTRVIDVGCPDSTSSRICITQGLYEPYVALSYCWGRGITALMLREDNLEALQIGLEEDQLVKTYQEAFQLTRELGFQYIWIDALCIIQGNKDDWEHESQKMGEVYGNAALTIVAARADDSRNGFLQNNFRPVADPYPFAYGRLDHSGNEITGLHVGLDREWFEETMKPDPVRTRGWCLQEAELSRRQLVFGSSGVSFQCKQTNIFEDQIYKFYHKRDVLPKGVAAFSTGGRDFPDRLECLNHWYAEFLPDYTSRLLTNRNDIFAAITALAKMAQLTVNGRYLAGLWESDLPRGLLWMPRYNTRWKVGPSKAEPNLSPLQRLSKSQAPSWSWASVQGPVQHGWDNKKRWPPYPYKSREGEFLVRPASEDDTSWTEQKDCDADVLYMPRCELKMHGRPRKLRCIGITQEKFMVWWDTEGRRIRQRPDDLPPRAKDAILFESVVSLRLEDREISNSWFDQIVAFGVFDVAGERVEEFWALPCTNALGLILGRNDDGTLHRLGVFHITNLAWFQAGEEELIRLI